MDNDQSINQATLGRCSCQITEYQNDGYVDRNDEQAVVVVDSRHHRPGTYRTESCI